MMDLSWSMGTSVNDGEKKNIYLCTEYELHYTSVDTIMNSLHNLGTSAQMYKIDIRRAFQHIKVDPEDIDLLGLQIQDEYFLDLFLGHSLYYASEWLP